MIHDVVFAWRGSLDDDELFDLVVSHGGNPERGWWNRIRIASAG